MEFARVRVLTLFCILSTGHLNPHMLLMTKTISIKLTTITEQKLLRWRAEFQRDISISSLIIKNSFLLSILVLNSQKKTFSQRQRSLREAKKSLGKKVPWYDETDR